MPLTKRLTNAIGSTKTNITSDTTLTQHFDLIEIDATSGNIIITLPLNTHVFRNKPSILFARIDSTINTVNIVGTSGNYADEGFLLGSDPLEESIRIYARNNNTWRKDGYGKSEQQALWAGFSTGLLSVGTFENEDDPTINVTTNSELDITSATQVLILSTRVNFELLDHNMTVGQTFVPTGNTPSDYNGIFTVDIVVDSDNVEALLLADPGGDATVVGTYDNTTFNIVFPGVARFLDRVNKLPNMVGDDTRFFDIRSKIIDYSAVSNVSHSAFPTGAVLFVLDDTGTISPIQLDNQDIDLPPFSKTEPHINSHIQLGRIVKNGLGVILETATRTLLSVNNNPFNRIRNEAITIGPINSTTNPIVISPIVSTIQVAINAGTAFERSELGFQPTEGFNPNQITITASSPATIVTFNRLGVGSIVNIDDEVNNSEIEFPAGTFVAIGPSKAANRFMIAFPTAITQLLGQTTYSGGTRLIDASLANEPVNRPSITDAGVMIVTISIEEAATDLDDPTEALFVELKQFR